MSKDIWHKKIEQPKKLLHCTRLIITKWGSVYSEKDIDNGAFIETDWAYLDDLLLLETELERTRKALDIANEKLKHCVNMTVEELDELKGNLLIAWNALSHFSKDPIANDALKKITTLKQKDVK